MSYIVSMTIHLTRKVDILNSSWDFRFMLDRKKATEDFVRFFPQYHPKDKNWVWSFAARDAPKMNRLGNLWGLLEPSVRSDYLTHFMGQLMRQSDYIHLMAIEILKTFMHHDLTREERYAVMFFLASTKHEAAMPLVFHWLKTSDDEALDWIEKNASQWARAHPPMLSVVYSFLLCTGDEERKERVKNIILEKGYEDALMVVRYATTEGWLKNVEDDRDVLVEQFRQGKSSLRMLSAFKKYQKNIIERIEIEDPIFKQSSHETFPYAVQFLSVRHPDEALELCEKNLRSQNHGNMVHLQAIIPYGLVGLKTEVLKETLNQSINQKKVNDALAYLKRLPIDVIQDLNDEYSHVRMLKYFWMIMNHAVIDTKELDKSEIKQLKEILSKKATKQWSAMSNDNNFQLNCNLLGFKAAFVLYIDTNSPHDRTDECEILL